MLTELEDIRRNYARTLGLTNFVVILPFITRGFA